MPERQLALSISRPTKPILDPVLTRCGWICLTMFALLLAGSLNDPRYLIMVLTNADILLIIPVVLTVSSLTRLFIYIRKLPSPRKVHRNWRPILSKIIHTREFWRYYFVPALLALTVYLLFPGLKQMIPQIRPYDTDLWLTTADQVLYGGHRPHHYLLPYLNPWVMLTLDRIYSSFFFVSLAFFIYIAHRKTDLELRAGFMTAFMLAWPILGIGVAALFSSVGPCFHELVPGGSKYVHLMENIAKADAHLQNFDLFLYSPRIQTYLSQLYLTHNVGFGGGISAMPSMHIAIPTLMMLTGWRIDWRLGSLTTLYMVLIGGGAISLGWHYSVDVYAGILFATLLWCAVHYRIIRRPFFEALP